MVDGDQVLCGGDSGTPPTACFADIWINVDGGTLEIPNSTTLPGLPCNAGEIYMDTDATSGQQLYGCEAGSWVLEGDGAGGGVGDMLKTTYDTDNNGTVDDSEALEGISLGTLTDTKVCTYDLASLEIDCNTDVGAGDMTKLVYDTDDDGTVNATESDVTWTLHNSYPAACSAREFVTAIGDTLTCAGESDPLIGTVEGSQVCRGTEGGSIECDYVIDGTGDCAASAICMGGHTHAADYQPLEATLTDIADGTIAENLVNTANPWANNEVADDITAGTATALAADPADCAVNQFANAIAASGALTCGAIGDADVPNDITINSSVVITSAVGFDAVGAVDLDYGSVDVTDHTFITDGTGDGEIVLPADSIGPAEIDSTTGAYDFGGVTSFEIPNADNPTVSAAGQVSVDSSAAPGSGIRFYGDAAYTLPGTQSKSFVILNPVATDDYPVWRVPYNITIKAVHLQCLGNVVVGHFVEMDANGLNEAGVDGATDITGVVNTNVNDDGTLSNPTIDATDYLGWRTTSITSTPTSVTITFEYTVDAVN